MNSNFKELRLAQVSRHFDNPSGQRVAALHELTLIIRRGELICLLGPSGCGKTTALNCIAGKLPGQLSGGQQQRVAIARAIVIEPPLLLMDEPLSNLDAKLRLEMRAEIRRIHKELGRTTIYVTHDQDEALSLADRIVVMKDGLVQQVAAPAEVYAQPANLHVARFMGYRNVIELNVTGKADGRVMLEGVGLKLQGTLKQAVDGKVSVATRPEDISIGSAGANLIEGRVVNSEYGGRDSLIDVIVGNDVLLHARTTERPQPGDTVKLTVAPERVLVYPAESGA